MSEQTQNLNLFKYNTKTDGQEVFSIDKALNDNWDKIDAFSQSIKSLKNLDEEGEKRFDNIWAELNKKLEAEVLLEENGYIKFNRMLDCSLPKLIIYIQNIYKLYKMYVLKLINRIWVTLGKVQKVPFYLPKINNVFNIFLMKFSTFIMENIITKHTFLKLGFQQEFK